MSTQRKPGPQEDGQPPSDEMVEKYLRDHPDFFASHTSLLTILRIPHPVTGAVSLVERQVGLLRDQNRQFKRKLMELVQAGRDNDRVSRQLHRLTLALIDARGVGQLVDNLFDHLYRDFKAEAVALRLYDLPAGEAEAANALALDREDPALASFAAFFRAGRPLCGRLKGEQIEYLFGEQAELVGSAALIPVGEHGSRGILAIASADSARFHRTMETLFLEHLGELLDRALACYLPGPPTPRQG
ncbi:MAG: DUF484 family protein [Gammaproteobacteria bacterium]